MTSAITNHDQKSFLIFGRINIFIICQRKYLMTKSLKKNSKPIETLETSDIFFVKLGFCTKLSLLSQRSQSLSSTLLSGRRLGETIYNLTAKWETDRVHRGFYK